MLAYPGMHAIAACPVKPTKIRWVTPGQPYKAVALCIVSIYTCMGCVCELDFRFFLYCTAQHSSIFWDIFPKDGQQRFHKF